MARNSEQTVLVTGGANGISPLWLHTSEDELAEADRNQHPVGRVGQPADIARAVDFLASPENAFITGANLVIDGGMTSKMIYVA